jgi:hypothetical protein
LGEVARACGVLAMFTQIESAVCTNMPPIERYTKAADQERMARNALARTNSELRTVKIREV